MSAPKLDRWQPIKTAPRDPHGELLLFDPGELGVGNGAVYLGAYTGTGWKDDAGYPIKPSHWMPLPEPPQ